MEDENSLLKQLWIVRNAADKGLGVTRDRNIQQKLLYIRNKIDDINFVCNLIDASSVEIVRKRGE